MNEFYKVPVYIVICTHSVFDYWVLERFLELFEERIKLGEGQGFAVDFRPRVTEDGTGAAVVLS